MKTFTKWFLLNAVMFTAIFFAEQKEAVSTMIENDLSYISILIMGLYVTVSGYIGRLCYLSDKINDKKKEEAKKAEEQKKKHDDEDVDPEEIERKKKAEEERLRKEKEEENR